MQFDLSGKWQFCIDRDRVGIREKWFDRDFEDTIPLPGTMEEAGYGDMPRKPSTHDLNHTFAYEGQAWYSRMVDCPEGDKVFLRLERVQWESWVFVNGHFVGMRNSLVAPHVYDITPYVTRPSFRLTIMQDNSNLVDNASTDILTQTEAGKDIYGRALTLHLHTAADKTKKLSCGIHMDMVSYNGIVGSIKLISKPKIYLESVHAYPDVENNAVSLRCVLSNEFALSGNAKISVQCQAPDGKQYAAEKKVALTGDGQKMELCCPLGEEKHLWDEFSPELYTYTLTLQTEAGQDEHAASFGMRHLAAKGRHIFLNDRRIFLRVTLEGEAFPYTGYTPMDESFWQRAFTILKRYGLNGMRMHSLVPPEAAFAAADKAGFYLQIELPGTSCPQTDEDPSVTEYLTNELKNLLEVYGDHPSFLLCSMGNEQLVAQDREFLARHQKMLQEKVALAKSIDPRHLYTSCSHPYTEGRDADDFYLVATKDEIVMNGIRWGGPDPITTSRFCLDTPSTAVNFEEGVLRMDKPSLTHEVGQWAVYPNLREMHKYTGVLKPRNFEIFAKQLYEAGLLDQIDDFVRASGQLSLLLYKEEIESALRTGDLSGFELLDLHDYPGQGTSTVGILDVFFDSKGLISEEDFRHFCGSVVPLAEMEKLVWTQDETLRAKLSVSDFSGKDIPENTMSVTLSYGAESVTKTLPCHIADGRLNPVGECLFPLSNLPVPCKCRLTAKLGKYENGWDVWVYPKAKEPEHGSVTVTDTLSEDVKARLERGESVLYIRGMENRPQHAVHGSMTSQFWNPFMKPQETRNGILTDPNQPVFSEFPTDFHTNWNWHDIIMHSWVLEMDRFPKAYFPMVQIVPGIKDNKKLGLLWECRVGRGKLLVCMADIQNVAGRPAAAQLKKSILDYMNSALFAPAQELDFSFVARELA